MSRRLGVLLLLLFLLSLPLAAEAKLAYEPYGEDEFPIWTMELRRAECIFFGSLVITYPVASLLFQVLTNEGILTKPEKSVDQMLTKAAIASGLSFVITTADYALGKME